MAALVCACLVGGLTPSAGAEARLGATRASSPAPGTIIETKGFVGSDGEWRYQIWRLRPDGTHGVPLTTDPDLLPHTAAPDPAGNLVAFTVGNGSRLPASGLYVMSISGYGRRNLLPHTTLNAVRDPTWSHDGSRLAFVALDSSFAYDIWVVGADGRGLRRVTRCNCAYTNTPRWSPTSNKLLWSPNTDDVAVLDVATGRSTELYDNRPSGAMNVRDYDWSPDGRSIVMAAYAWNDSTPDLYRLPLSGGTPVRLTQEAMLSYAAPHVSPDGTQLVTSVVDTSGTDQNGSDLWIVDAANGTATPPRTYEQPYQEAATAWAHTCRTRCAPGGRWSSLSTSFTTTGKAVRMTGGLMPGRAGAVITVTLQKRVGQAWRQVRSARVKTSALSLYTARLPRAAASLCRLTARWAGSAQHRAVAATTRSFGC
jgi:hypothetical protein